MSVQENQEPSSGWKFGGEIFSEDVVMAMAACVNMLGLALGFYVNEYCYIVSLFVSVNLLQSAFTKACPAEVVFVKVFGIRRMRELVYKYGPVDQKVDVSDDSWKFGGELFSEDMVFAMAACVNMLGLALGVFVSEWCLIVSLFVSVNLFQSAFTHACPAEIIFVKLFGVRRMRELVYQYAPMGDESNADKGAINA